ncbi:unnamed protein product, partial [Strongylus vulgaris]
MRLGTSCEESDGSQLPCPQGYLNFTKDGSIRCHNHDMNRYGPLQSYFQLTFGSYSYEEADRICRSRGGELSMLSDEEELLMLRNETKKQGVEGYIMLRKEEEANDTCIFFKVNDCDNSTVEMDCNGLEAAQSKGFACMLPESLECTVKDGGQTCKMIACQKGEASYYRTNGTLVCHKFKKSQEEFLAARKKRAMEPYGLVADGDSNRKHMHFIASKTNPFAWDFDDTLNKIGPYNNFDEGEPDGDRR